MAELWSIMGWIALLQAFTPPQLRAFFYQHIERFCARICKFFRDRYVCVEVQEDIKGSYRGNLLYGDVELYLSSLDCLHNCDYLRAQRRNESGGIAYTLPPNETIYDTFMATRVSWTHKTVRSHGHAPAYDIYGCNNTDANKETRSFSLSLPLPARDRILSAYLAHIVQTAREVERSKCQRKLYTNNGQDWESLDFKHPSTFDTLALLPEVKEHVKADLLAFKKGESFYHSVGRAWKRGYLLYGPPGTGKSSMIAAMANYLSYDIYDLELTSVSDNAELKSLLMRTTRKSIIVIEDIDCSMDLSERSTKSVQDGTKSDNDDRVATKVTLSGLLNSTDGLWSCCGEERIFVFTTNHKEKLDPALLRCGRMDMHILLPYCTFQAFKVLCHNFLGLDEEHELYHAVEKLLGSCNVTPAEVVELLMSSKTVGPSTKALERVVSSLEEKSKQSSASVSPNARNQSRSLSMQSAKTYRAVKRLLSMRCKSLPKGT